jgi:hypothetical protein
VNQRGEVVGIVSHGHDKSADYGGSAPRPYLTLPVYLAKRVLSE